MKFLDFIRVYSEYDYDVRIKNIWINVNNIFLIWFSKIKVAANDWEESEY